MSARAHRQPLDPLVPPRSVAGSLVRPADLVIDNESRPSIEFTHADLKRRLRALLRLPCLSPRDTLGVDPRAASRGIHTEVPDRHGDDPDDAHPYRVLGVWLRAPPPRTGLPPGGQPVRLRAATGTGAVSRRVGPAAAGHARDAGLYWRSQPAYRLRHEVLPAAHAHPHSGRRHRRAAPVP